MSADEKRRTRDLAERLYVQVLMPPQPGMLYDETACGAAARWALVAANVYAAEAERARQRGGPDLPEESPSGLVVVP